MNNIENYIGHPHQTSGAEEFTIAKGKGKGMALIEVRNGKGLCITLCPDRCLDIVRVDFKGDNMGYFAPCGYVSPQFYDKNGAGFLKSFTAGFMTTCGISAVGSPCTDNGETLPLHGNISHTPCEEYSYFESEDEIRVIGNIRDASIFGTSYLLEREYVISKTENKFGFSDKVKNIGNSIAPCMLLYHVNIGYPMLTENSKVIIPSDAAKPRNAHSAAHFEKRLEMEVPQDGYEECCYYYDVKSQNGIASVEISNPEIGKKLEISYGKESLGFFTQWKMMGKKEYVIGLEPGNCSPDGRDVMRQSGKLIELAPNEIYKTNIEFKFSEETV